jgi:hypothetical protein
LRGLAHLLVAARLLDLRQETLVGVLVAECPADPWRVKLLEAVVVEHSHLVHAAHMCIREHGSALVPCARTANASCGSTTKH